MVNFVWVDSGEIFVIKGAFATFTTIWFCSILSLGSIPVIYDRLRYYSCFSHFSLCAKETYISRSFTFFALWFTTTILIFDTEPLFLARHRIKKCAKRKNAFAHKTDIKWRELFILPKKWSLKKDENRIKKIN